MDRADIQALVVMLELTDSAGRKCLLNTGEGVSCSGGLVVLFWGGGWHYLLHITCLLLMTCVGVEQTHFNPHNMFLHMYGEHKLQVLPPCHM